MRAVIVFLLFCTCIAAVSAADLRFRSGRIVAAELSRNLPQVTDADRFVLPPEKRKGTAAALVLELNPGRMISIHDYRLLVHGREYPAAALRVGDGPFSAKGTETAARLGERITMLYFIPSGLPGKGTVTLKLIPVAPPREQSVQIRFAHLENRNFTPPSRIAKEGSLK